MGVFRIIKRLSVLTVCILLLLCCADIVLAAEAPSPGETVTALSCGGYVVSPSASVSGPPALSDGQPLGYLYDGYEAASLSSSGGIPMLSTVPVSYSLRAQNLMSPVKSQLPYGTCWSFAVMGSAESNLLKKGFSADLSELHLVNYTYVRNAVVAAAGGMTGDIVEHNGDLLDDGGNTRNAVTALACWLGFVGETTLPYGEPGFTYLQNRNLDDSLAYNSDIYYLSDADFVNMKSDAQVVKSMLMEKGAAVVSYYQISSSNPYFNTATNAYYQTVTSSSNHAVTLCGWDDSFPASSFATAPPGNGAWLLKNSWGESWGDGGYFWISYYDPSVLTCCFFDLDSSEKYNRQYQYDGGLYNGYFFWDTDLNTVYGANVFTAAASDELTAIGLFTDKTMVSATVDIYTGVSDSPSSGVIHSGAHTAQTLYYEGYHTIVLNEPVQLTAGEKFSVVVKHVIPSGTATVVIDYPIDDSEYFTRLSHTRASAGQSYGSNDGSTWEDISEAGMNMRIKAKTRSSLRPTYIRGDVDYSGSPTISDAVLIARFCTGLRSFDGVRRAHADVNNDGSVSVSDVVYLCRYVAQMQGYKTLAEMVR